MSRNLSRFESGMVMLAQLPACAAGGLSRWAQLGFGRPGFTTPDTPDAADRVARSYARAPRPQILASPGFRGRGVLEGKRTIWKTARCRHALGDGMTPPPPR